MRLLVLISCFIQLGAYAQQPSHRAVIWQGYSHQWTYNHRCNRLGDYVKHVEGNPVHVHASATGTGPDSTYYNADVVTVQANDIWFKEGEIETHITGKNKELHTKDLIIAIPLTDSLRFTNQYNIFLNGFDLKAESAADKVQLMRIDIDDPKAYVANNILYCPVHIALVFNCQSLECDLTSTHFAYNLKVHYMLLAWKDDAAKASTEIFTNTYAWNQKDEIFNDATNETLIGVNSPVYKNAFVGIRSFSLALDKAMWLLEFNNKIIPGEYNPATGSMNLQMQMSFKEWRANMQKSDVSKYSEFSFSRSGWAMVMMEAELMQFHRGATRRNNVTGAMYWQGKGAKPDIDQAISIKPIPILD